MALVISIYAKQGEQRSWFHTGPMNYSISQTEFLGFVMMWPFYTGVDTYPRLLECGRSLRRGKRP
jgi:hypothetical protein